VTSRRNECFNFTILAKEVGSRVIHGACETMEMFKKVARDDGPRVRRRAEEEAERRKDLKERILYESCGRTRKKEVPSFHEATAEE
jgi:hypothetical protein